MSWRKYCSLSCLKRWKSFKNSHLLRRWSLVRRSNFLKYFISLPYSIIYLSWNVNSTLIINFCQSRNHVKLTWQLLQRLDSSVLPLLRWIWPSRFQKRTCHLQRPSSLLQRAQHHNLKIRRSRSQVRALHESRESRHRWRICRRPGDSHVDQLPWVTSKKW